MRCKRGGRLPSELAELRRRVEEWRESGGAWRMPDELWKEAIALGRVHGVGRVSRALGLNHSRLKERLQKEGSPEEAVPSFVELSVGPPFWGNGFVVDTARAGEARMTLTAGDVQTVLALPKAFWGSGR